MADADSLVVFARFPRPGLVKTRLAKALGDAGAAELYDAFLQDLVRRFAHVPYRVRWRVAPPQGSFASHFGLDPTSCVEQKGRDLGQRMHHAFAEELAEAPGRCVLIGSDTPHLPLARIDAAFAALEEADLVLGPARDGGYYLIGMREAYDVFSSITWSTELVLSETERRACSLDLRVEYIEEDFDVDESRDLAALRLHLEGDSGLCPATMRALASLADR